MTLDELIEALPLAHATLFIVPEGIQFFYTPVTRFEEVKKWVESIGDWIVESDQSSFTIAHHTLYPFLCASGVQKMGLKEAINALYLQHGSDRAAYLAQESLQIQPTDHPMPHGLLHVEQVAKAPQPNQLIARMQIQMSSLRMQEAVASPLRLVFILDRSGSMHKENRIALLKQAVLDTITHAPAETRVSIYFYNDHVTTLCVDKPASLWTAEDTESLMQVKAESQTDVSCAFRQCISDMQETGTLHDPAAFANTTIIWATDGEDKTIKTSDNVVTLLRTLGCVCMPKLIAVGMGDYCHQLLNGVAEDDLFRAHLLIHIDSGFDMHTLFGILSRCMGVNYQSVIVVWEAAGQMSYQDLGMLHASLDKSWIMEMPVPTSDKPTVCCRVIVDEQIYIMDFAVSLKDQAQNYELLADYFEQWKDKITLARHNHPDPKAANEMQARALALIPTCVRHRRLRELRAHFLPRKKTSSLLEDELIHVSSSSSMWASERSQCQDSSQMHYSQALQNSYL